MNSHVTGLDDTDFLLLVGCNPKIECPVINARIRKNVLVNGLEVGVVGPANNLSYNYHHIGSSTQVLKEIAEGTHPFCDRLA